MYIEEPKTSPSSATVPISSPIKKENIQIGTTNFAELVEHGSFVDKTLLIKDFVTSGVKTMLITCPRRFGKSTNMNMIKTFLEIEVSEDGNPLPKGHKKNHKLFEDDLSGDSLRAKQKLLISEDKEFVQEHLGQYPVIFVTFKGILGQEYELVLNQLKIAISATFQDHEYMINVLDKRSKNATTALEEKKAKDSYSKFMKFFTNNAQNATQEEIENSLKFLSKLLYDHFKKKVYVLIDEYDIPISRIMYSNLTDNVSPTNNLIDSVLGAVLKDNDTYLAQGLITGISILAKNSSSSALNNVVVYRFLNNHQYGQYYGFTDYDISKLITHKDELNLVTSYYNGYLIVEQNLKIYNPWSVMQYIKSGKAENYWCQSGAITSIKKLFQYNKFRDQLNLLIKDNGISFQFNETPEIEDIQNLKNLLNSSVQEISEDHINLFFSYIFEQGYLTPVKPTGQPTSISICNYQIPNKEIEQEFARKAIGYYIDTYKFKKDDVDTTIAALESINNNYNDSDLSSKINQLKSSIQKLCQYLEFSKISACEDGSHPNVSLLHTIVGWIIMQSNAKKIGSEVPINSGMQSGKANIVSTYKELGKIIELKFKKTAKEALEQIKDKNYNAIFSKLPCIKKILNIGINLDENKEVTIEYILYNNDNLSGNSYQVFYLYT